MNEFFHVSVLYAEYLPSELSSGMLGNKSYLDRNAHLRQDGTLRELQTTPPMSSSSWYSFARDLMKAEGLEEVASEWKGRVPLIDLFLNLLHRDAEGWGEIWEKAQTRLEQYKEGFEAVWSPISDSILSRLASLAKRQWRTDEIRVHFADCLYGGFAWHDCIAFATLPDTEVQKKFITHELSELITPSRLVEESLGEAGLDPGIVHTVVDMLAYFSVKDFIAKPVYPHPERRGVVPNSNYYPKVEELYPVFDNYSKNPSKYDGLGSLIEEIILRLKKS